MPPELRSDCHARSWCLDEEDFDLDPEAGIDDPPRSEACGGLADWEGFDPEIVRALTAPPVPSDPEGPLSCIQTQKASSAIDLARETHVRDLGTGETSAVQISLLLGILRVTSTPAENSGP
jgi:hypothetical protein